MPDKPATVKSPDSLQGTAVDSAPNAEAIRLRLADAWGEMGAAWGVAPAIARVHAYLMARAEPMTEREVREALGLSHRATSIALRDAADWGIVERVDEPRRVGSRGPRGTAYSAVGDHWLWFERVIAGRKIREGDPIIAVLERTMEEVRAGVTDRPDDLELVALAAWLGDFLAFVRLFDRAVDLVPSIEPRSLERALRLLDRLSDDQVARLARLLEAVPDEDVLPLVDALSRLTPTTASRAARAMRRVIASILR